MIPECVIFTDVKHNVAITSDTNAARQQHAEVSLHANKLLQRSSFCASMLQRGYPVCCAAGNSNDCELVFRPVLFISHFLTLTSFLSDKGGLEMPGFLADSVACFDFLLHIWCAVGLYIAAE